MGALFTDYDGTIAPGDVTREESRIPGRIASRLVALSSKVPIGVITSKDYDFIRPRTSSFATAWACVAGLDLRMADGSGLTLPNTADVSSLVRRIEDTLPSGTLVERKHASDGGGDVLGFSIDWTSSSGFPVELATSIAKQLRESGLYVSHAPWQSFLDAFSVKPDKGGALVTLAKRLGVTGATVYLGDSEMDNDAFDSCAVGIGVEHGQPTEKLRCNYVVPFARVDRLLGYLFDNIHAFHPDKCEELRVR